MCAGPEHQMKNSSHNDTNRSSTDQQTLGMWTGRGKKKKNNMHMYTQKVTLQMQFQHVTPHTGPLLYA